MKQRIKQKKIMVQIDKQNNGTDNQIKQNNATKK